VVEGKTRVLVICQGMQLSCEKREEETRGDWDGSMRRQEDIPPEKEKEELEYVGK
jgi:hypothetical protein